jgi:hypothetical protein
MASAIQPSFRPRGQGQNGRPLRASLANRVREFLDALLEARGQPGLGLQLLAQADGRMEIARPRPAHDLNATRSGTQAPSGRLQERRPPGPARHAASREAVATVPRRV